MELRTDVGWEGISERVFLSAEMEEAKQFIRLTEVHLAPFGLHFIM